MFDNWLLFGGCVCFVMLSLCFDVKSGDILCVGMVGYFFELVGVWFDYCWGGLVDIIVDWLLCVG